MNVGILRPGITEFVASQYRIIADPQSQQYIQKFTFLKQNPISYDTQCLWCPRHQIIIKPERRSNIYRVSSTIRNCALLTLSHLFYNL